MVIVVPHPFPVKLNDQVNSELRRAGVLDKDAKYTVRKLIADAYAEGFADGYNVAYWNNTTDTLDKRDAEKK